MKHLHLHLLLLLSLLSLFPATFAGDAGQVAPDVQAFDSAGIRPVQVDTKTRNSFKDDDRYDYYSHKTDSETFFLWRMLDDFFRWLASLFGDNPGGKTDSNRNYLFLLAGLLPVAGLLVWGYRLFFKNTQLKRDAMEEDSIYGIDFDRQLEKAVQAKNYTEAIRLQYLQILKLLQDGELIDWRPHKTVTEYLYDLKDLQTRKLYHEISSYFLYFRYGNFKAGEAHYAMVETLSEQIKNIIHA
ncbi:MAG: DUF4129 domain-containing protein [Dysgonamonadaceae bacterium]|jgi:hypothetical protein|nr:DUF4129 domain-containing protein [Dysgonamonadaceae bacterium]